MKKHLSTAAALIAITATATFGATGAQAEPGGHDQKATKGLVASIRKAIDPYRDVDTATDDGYVRVSGCEQSEAGGMGYHYLNPEVASSGIVDPARPTILLYGPGANGGLELLGAEWWQPDLGQDRPYLEGEPFNGPMPGHDEHMPTHYDLHVWTHVANPAGVFATWNPRVSC